MKCYYLTDKGKVRSHNEDGVTIVKNLSNETLMVVADGMGGHKAGEVASSLAITKLGQRFSSLSSIGAKEEAVEWIRNIINEINIDILKYAEKHIDSKGLGTTCVCALITSDYLLFGNIGDSSGFVFKNDKLTKVTSDHTIVGMLVKTGELTEEEAKNHPQKNVLLRALGSNEKIEIDLFDVETSVDGVFLCSDGLTNMVNPEQIQKVLIDDLSIEEKMNKLIVKANLRGGNDNISVAYADMERGDK
ncbi:MAG: Stp1/IreP family PP2C-type Ser/Thr phosphatase [Bacilli bacterium]